jgi:uncharacterized iron-regulated membrane protein
MSLPWNMLLLLCLLVIIVLFTFTVIVLWMKGRRERRKTPVRPARRRVELERQPVPNRDPQPTSEDHQAVEELLRSLKPPPR